MTLLMLTQLWQGGVLGGEKARMPILKDRQSLAYCLFQHTQERAQPTATMPRQTGAPTTNTTTHTLHTSAAASLSCSPASFCCCDSSLLLLAAAASCIRASLPSSTCCVGVLECSVV